MPPRIGVGSRRSFVVIYFTSSILQCDKDGHVSSHFAFVPSCLVRPRALVARFWLQRLLLLTQLDRFYYLSLLAIFTRSRERGARWEAVHREYWNCIMTTLLFLFSAHKQVARARATLCNCYFFLHGAAQLSSLSQLWNGVVCRVFNPCMHRWNSSFTIFFAGQTHWEGQQRRKNERERREDEEKQTEKKKTFSKSSRAREPASSI